MFHKLVLVTMIALTLAACSNATQTPVPPPTATHAPPSPTATAPANGDDIHVYGILPDKTTASYEVGEVFINEGNKYNLAIGRTGAVSGDIALNFTHPEQSTVGVITVDISTLTSDSRRRDDRIRNEWLESATYPLATFTGTEVKGLPSSYQDGTELTFEVVGDLKVREVTRVATFAVTAKLENEQLSGTVTTTILMTDFGFDPPNIAGMIKAEDEAKIVLKFVAGPVQ